MKSATAVALSPDPNTPVAIPAPASNAASLKAIGYWSEAEFCAAFGISLRTARRWEYSRVGPRRTRVQNSIYYSQQAIEEWMANHTPKPARVRARRRRVDA